MRPNLNPSFSYWQPVLTQPGLLPLLGATCKVASTLSTALPWQLGGSKLTRCCCHATGAMFASVGYMELDQPTPVSCPPSLKWCMCTMLHTHHSKVLSLLSSFWLLGYDEWCAGAGAIQGKDGGIQVLAGLVPSIKNRRIQYYSVSWASLHLLMNDRRKHSSGLLALTQLPAEGCGNCGSHLAGGS